MISIHTIGVIGAGQMGRGIAQTAITARFNVILYDVSSDQLKTAQTLIQASLEKLATKGIIKELPQAILKRLSFCQHLKDLRESDFIIEAAPEDESLKNTIFKEVTPYLKSVAIVASNTSSLSITRLASRTDRPERFIGMHFMNPVPLMQLVEITKGLATSEEAYRITHQLGKSLGKEIAVSKDTPGFIINRILMPMINEAIVTLQEGVGTREDIDKSMKLGAHHPMGPLELADFIGLDTCLAIMRVLHQGLGEDKYRPCPLLTTYVDAGWLGRKTGRGFYEYSQ